LRCKACTFTFGYPFVGGDEEFYSILHEQQGYPTWRWDYDVAIREALSPLKGGRILDIGAGSGIFLRQLGPQWNRYAVEASELTIQPLEELGIQVFRDLATAAQSEAGLFQVVTLFQVLEHLSEFRPVLAQCRQLLGAGGRLVITVPDGDAMIRQEKLTGCPDMPPHHINKWTPTSLSKVLREEGFEPQPAIFEPTSWHNVRGALHLKMIADATHPRSLAAQAYRISHKKVRTLLLAGLGLAALVKMLPAVPQLKQGGAFAMIGMVVEQ
jgi:SAM-dependent methyltransferase